MANFRVHKNEEFVSMGKCHFKEKEMSLKAIGLLSLMLSLPKNWDYSVAGLKAIRCESKNTINSILKELEDFGYLERTQIRNTKGIIVGYEYDIFEEPHLKNRDMEKRDMEKRDMENCTQLNNINNLITNNLITKEYIKETYFENGELNELFKEFLKQRKKLKAVNSERAINNLINTLKDYPLEVQMQMINNSITNSWKGLFPLKGNDIKKNKNSEQWELLKGLANGNIKYTNENNNNDFDI